MILKGSQRGGALQLATHLMNERDNDHIALHELRGFVSNDLAGALDEMHAVSKGTRCQQFMFSLSLSPPKNADCKTQEFMEAAERAERALGLEGQPRAIIFHEKEGRLHAHVVWSRIDAREMKAINLPFFKTRLNGLSKDLYLEHGWPLPDGHRENGWKNPLNFTLAEWQQAKRLGLDPRELKQVFQSAWAQSDGLKSFRSALEAHGYYLAAGDRRGFVAVDLRGEVFSVSRMCGVNTKALSAKLGSPDRLPSVADVTSANAERLSIRMRELLQISKEEQARAIEPLLEERTQIKASQQQERARLKLLQEQRWQEETQARQGRFRKGFAGLLDRVTGRAALMRKENELAALAAHQRDEAQRERLREAQFEDRRDLQSRIDACRKTQREQRMQAARQVAFLLELERAEGMPLDAPPRRRNRGLTMH